MMKASPFLSRLRWHTASLILQNTRSGCSREHPLSIFDAVFKFAAGTSEGLRGMEYFFHPTGPLERFVQKGDTYGLELVFPLAPREKCEAFVEAVRQWLADPAHNFSLREAGPVRERSLDALAAEHPELRQAGEVCLDFLTPLSVKPATHRDMHRFCGTDLFRLFANRLRRWYGEEAAAALEPFRAAFASARLLPWFWEYAEFRHEARSHPGKQYVCGMLGPLYLRGDIAALLPLLLVGQELHAGPKQSAGQGAYRLLEDRPFLDARLAEERWYASALAQCEQETDLPFAGEDELPALLEACASGEWKSGVAELARRSDPPYFIAPVPGGARPGREAILPPADLLLQRAVRNMLAPCVDAALPPSVLRRTAAPAQAAGPRLHIPVCGLEEVPHGRFLELAASFLPASDSATLSFLREAITMRVRADGQEQARDRGLLPGSPLAPLLADLFLLPADKALADKGMLRQGALFTCPGPEAIPLAQAAVAEALAPLGLRAGEAVQEGDCPDREVAWPERRPLHVRGHGAFAGLDGDSVLVRQDDDETGRIPLQCVGEICLQGAGSVSTKLVQRCVSENIPLSFCTPSGWHIGTLLPASRHWYAGIGTHAARYAALSAEQKAEAARMVLRAKLNGALWLMPRTADRKALQEHLERAGASLARARTPQEMMGVEGALARAMYPMVNALVLDAAFRSERRDPHAKADLWNALLDACYSLLFSRLHVHLLSAGLDPYLGFLHSAKDRYPSLAADLQEGFRHRADQLAVKVVNQRVVRPGHFTFKGGRWRMEKAGYAALVRAFESMLDTIYSGETHTVRFGIHTQIDAVKAWVQGRPLALKEWPCRR